MNNRKWFQFSKEQLAEMSFFQRLCLKVVLFVLIKYYDFKVIFWLQVLGFIGLFNKEAKLNYTVTKYNLRKERERR